MMSSTKQFLLSFIICLVAFSLIGIGLLKFFSSDDSNTIKDDGTVGLPDNITDDPSNDDPSNEGKSATKKTGRTVSALFVGLDPVDPDTHEIDALIVVKADVDNKQLYVCSVPTDIQYEISGVYSTGSEEEQDYTYYMSFKNTLIERERTDGTFTKGLEYITGKVSALTGVNIDYYFAVDTKQAASVFNRFTADSPVYYLVPEWMKYDYNPKYDEETGEMIYDYNDSPHDIYVYEGKHEKLNGSEAVQISRFVDYTRDGDRQSTQVSLIEAFVKAALSDKNALKTQLFETNDPFALVGISKKNTNITAEQVKDNLDFVFSLSEYEFNAVPFNYNGRITNSKVPALHEDFN